MTQEELEQVQSIQLEIMDEVHRICVKNHITYYMIAGTLLGSVRHSGFIPWDLDIDLAMMRDEYERFRTACMRELDESFAYLDFRTIPDYARPHALVSRKNTRLYLKYDRLNPKRENYGVYLDIFPLDNAPDQEALRRRQARRLRWIKKFKDYRIPYSYSRSAQRRNMHYLVSALLRWIPVRAINGWQQRQMQRYRGVETKCVCSMASKYAYEKQCMPREIYGKARLLDFCGRQYYAPEKYTEYLTRLYGDFMTLPPVEQQRANLEVFAALEMDHAADEE